MFRFSTRSALVNPQTRSSRAKNRRLRGEQLESRNLLAVITVDTYIDELDGSITDGDISLRDAINAASKQDTISFNEALSGATITLVDNGLEIDTTLTIDASQLTDRLNIVADDTVAFTTKGTPTLTLRGISIRGINRTRSLLPRFEIEQPAPTCGAIDSGGDVQVFDSTIERTLGHAVVCGKNVQVERTEIRNNIGTGVLASQTATIVESTISENGSYLGDVGAIESDLITIRDSVVTRNSAENETYEWFSGWDYQGRGDGTAIHGREIVVTDTLIAENLAQGAGINIRAIESLQIVNSTITQSGWNINKCDRASWGASIWSDGNVTIQGSEVSMNCGTGVGAVTASVSNSTISGNMGGGVSVDKDLEINHSTIVDNQWTGVSSETEIQIKNSIVARNVRSDISKNATVRFSLIGSNENTDLVEARVANADGNLVGTKTEPFDPKLFPLADNSGRTKTHKPMKQSRVLNAADPDSRLDGQFDQRGAPHIRVYERLDMGAFEWQPSGPLVTVDLATDEDDGDVSYGDISLREALKLANDGTRIVFESTLDPVITLTQGELTVTKSVILDGEQRISLDASGNDPTPSSDSGDGSRVLSIDEGAGLVTLSHLHLTGGDVSGNGGAVFSKGNAIELNSVTIDGNFATGSGGGVYASDLNLRNSEVSNNRAGTDGGGLFVDGTSVSIETSSISENSASGHGGGVFSELHLSISDATIGMNSADLDGGGIYALGLLNVRDFRTTDNRTLGSGGGIFADGLASIAEGNIARNSSGAGGGGVFTLGTLTMDRSSIHQNTSAENGAGLLTRESANVYASTFSENKAAGHGGAVYSYGTLGIESSTFSSNEAQGTGGGLSGTAAHLTVSHSTIWGNTAALGGGLSAEDIGVLEIDASIVAGNIDENGANDLAASPTRTALSVSRTLIGDSAGSGIVSLGPHSPDENGNIIGDRSGIGVIDPMLAPLSFNGGPTQTHFPNQGSPVIEAGDATGDSPDLDQRGFPRLTGFRIDLGAVETNHVFTNVVDNLEDESDGDYSPGDISLREMLERAVDGTEISFDRSLNGGRIDLEHGSLFITKSLSINASMLESGITIVAAEGGKAFEVLDGLDDPLREAEVAFDNLVIVGHVETFEHSSFRNVTLNGARECAIAISSSKIKVDVIESNLSGNQCGIESTNESIDLKVESSQIAGNRGAGIALESGAIIVSDSSINNNGFGIKGSRAEIRSSTISGNAGGGVEARSAAIHSSSISNNGGTGIRVAGDTLLDSTVVANNSGHGVYLKAHVNSAPTVDLDISNSVITGNSVDGNGGGIHMNVRGSYEYLYNYFHDVSGYLTITSSTIAGNSATGNGGGIYQFANHDWIYFAHDRDAPMVVASSEVTGNTSGRNGGGIYSRANQVGFPGVAAINSSTISGNIASKDGGGIFGASKLFQSTLSGNVADGTGGGVAGSPGVVITSTTITENRSPATGGVSTSKDGRVENSIVAGNLGRNFDNTGNFSIANSLNNADPMLAPLGDYGGLTKSHVPLPGSPAINNGAVDSPPTYDQRGAPFQRIVGGSIDIGAVEFQMRDSDLDFNNDSRLNCNDVDAIVEVIVSATNGNELPSQFDLNGDRLVTNDDLDYWLNFAGFENQQMIYQRGDANLDGAVDFADLNHLGMNWGQQNTGWCGGDMNADGTIDAEDLSILAKNWLKNRTQQRSEPGHTIASEKSHIERTPFEHRKAGGQSKAATFARRNSDTPHFRTSKPIVRHHRGRIFRTSQSVAQEDAENLALRHEFDTSDDVLRDGT